MKELINKFLNEGKKIMNEIISRQEEKNIWNVRIQSRKMNEDCEKE